jgi:hypothetical protein
MVTRAVIDRLSGRIDDLAGQLGLSRGPIHLVVGNADEGPAAVTKHLERHPSDVGRQMVVIATGVPRAGDAR